MILPSGLSTYDYSRPASAKGWGSGWPTCGAGPATDVTLARSGVKLYNVHVRIARLLELIGNEIERRGYLFHPGWCWGGSCRNIANTVIPSNHSWLIAADWDAPTNPYSSAPGHTIPDWAYAIFRAYGFGCGCDYTGGKKDWMHVEFMGTPGDATMMTALAERAFGNPGNNPGNPVIVVKPLAPAPAGIPGFPLPAGYYYGPRSGPRESISGMAGESGAWIEGLKAAQRRLMLHLPGCLSRYGPDGKYGQDAAGETHDAVAKFQRVSGRGLAVDGLIGSRTWTELYR